MKSFLYIMSNDLKWMEMEQDLPFVPYLGFDFTGIGGEHILRIISASYNIFDQTFKIRLTWMDDAPLDSSDMVDLGWRIISISNKVKASQNNLLS